MADENESGADRRAEPAAAALALNGGPLDPQAREYLEEQTNLARLQVEELKEERKLRHWSAVVRHFSDVMKLTFEVAIALIALAVVVFIGAALWSAANDNGLVIEAFNVPPDLAAKGLTGQVVAAQVQDKLASLQAQTNSMRAASSYENNWGSDIKVQIPETGVSIGQFNDYLRQWLGHETRISGEIFRNARGIAVTARVGGGEGQTYAGSEADLDALLQKAAEAVYRQTQPYRYGVYLMNHNRNADAAKVYQALTADPSARERAWAYIGLGNLAQARGDIPGALQFTANAIAANPELVLAYINREQYQQNLQHLEDAYQTARKLDEIFRSSRESDINPAAVESNSLANAAQIAAWQGDFQAALDLNRQIEAEPDYSGSIENARQGDLQAYAFMHDGAAVRRILATEGPAPNLNARINRDLNAFAVRVLTGDVAGALAGRGALETELSAFPAASPARRRIVNPLFALALALKGDHAAAAAMIAATPLDCDLCLRVRGSVAAANDDWAQAAHWFALEAGREPSMAQGDTDLGWALLNKGDLDGAIARLAAANRLGPHFADPLVYWGEALMQKNRSDLALAKFEEANKYAPNWGRLHLKWGQALLYTGDKAGAARQFAIATGLDLTPSEKSGLAKAQQHG